MKALISTKSYRCQRCGHITQQETNHYGATWSFGRSNTCPKCPPWAKYPEFGGGTIWECTQVPILIRGDTTGMLESVSPVQVRFLSLCIPHREKIRLRRQSQTIIDLLLAGF